MAKTISVDVPHKLGAAEAKARIEAGEKELRARFAQYLSGVEVNWSGDHADLRIGALGQTLTGALDVAPDVVRVSLDLPWALALIAEKAKGFIQTRTTQALQLPAPKP